MRKPRYVTKNGRTYGPYTTPEPHYKRTVSVSAKAYQRLSIRAHGLGTTITALVQRMIRDAIKGRSA